MWDIDFITEDNFKEHVYNTVKHYGNKLISYDVAAFNRNLIDPIKMIFDKAVYKLDWDEIIRNEIFRQRDKSNTNEIGYFHQHMFKYIDNCDVPANGNKGGWDVIYTPVNGYDLGEGGIVRKIYVEMKNKHNTMNSSSSDKTYMKMQHQLLEDDKGACFLVEAIADNSQNIVWKKTLDGRRVSHNRIRRVSLDLFYAVVTGDKDAFLKICLQLPGVVHDVIQCGEFEIDTPCDTVYDELLNMSNIDNVSDALREKFKDDAIMMSMYMLGFGTYNGFSNKDGD